MGRWAGASEAAGTMSPRSLITAIGTRLPRGWGDLGRQLAIFALLDMAYELSRTFAVGDRSTAIRHAHSIVNTERSLGLFHELDLQQWALHAPSIVMSVANWTYFNCQFTLTFGFVLFVYLRRNEFYTRLRNLIATVNLIGLAGYIFYPAAPPRMLTDLGFVDSLNQTGVNHHSGLIAMLSNPYAAMPSLHTAYAITIGATGFAMTRSRLRFAWVGYPALVVFSIVVTANHFFLDAIAGAGVAATAFLLVSSPRIRRVAAVAAVAVVAGLAAIRAARVGGTAWGALDGAAVSLIAFAVLANLASVAAKIGVWRRTLAVSPDGAQIRHRDLTPAVFIGFLVNTIVPARLGEVAKLAILGRRTRERGVAVPAGALAGSLAAEQIVLAGALVLVAAAGTVASSSAPMWVLATLAPMSAAVVLLAASAARLERVAVRLPGRAGPIAVDALSHARAAFSGRDRGLGALGLGIASWAFQIAGIVFTLQAFGLPHSIQAASAVFVASTLVGIVPLVPGNVGVFSAAVAAALAPFGVGAAEAAAFGLALQGVEALLSVAAGGALPGIRRAVACRAPARGAPGSPRAAARRRDDRPGAQRASPRRARRLAAQAATGRGEKPEALERLSQPVLERDPGLPAEDLAGPRDVGLAHLRIVGRKALEDDLRAGAREQRGSGSASSSSVISSGFPTLTGRCSSLIARRKRPSIRSST